MLYTILAWLKCSMNVLSLKHIYQFNVQCKLKSIRKKKVPRYLPKDHNRMDKFFRIVFCSQVQNIFQLVEPESRRNTLELNLICKSNW